MQRLSRRPQQTSKQKQYKKKDLLGSGTFGKVYKCLNIKKGKNQALKVIQNASVFHLEAIEYEAEAMMKTKSDNTVPLIDHYFDEQDQSYVFVMPYYKKGNLTKYMDKKWSKTEILCFLSQICEGFLSLIHASCWHLDLKPDNIILKNQNQYLICDFGCAKLLGGDHLDASSRFIQLSMGQGKGLGTTLYAAPEVITNIQGGKYSDMWSLGIILYEILYKQHPLKNKLKDKENFVPYSTIIKKFKDKLIKIDYNQLNGLQEIIEICKQMLKPDKRLDWKELKNMIYKYMRLPKTTPIVCNIQMIMNYAHDVSSIVLGLIHYFSINRQNLQKFGILQAAGNLTTISKAFVFLLYDQVQSAVFQEQHNPHVQFYLFPETKANLKIQQSQKLRYLIDNAKQYTQKDYQKVDDRSLTNLRLNFNAEIKSFFDKLKSKSEGYKCQGSGGQMFNHCFQWNKIVQICTFIISNNQKLQGLNYIDKDKIAEFAQKIINQ